jgi:hypothetical protein
MPVPGQSDCDPNSRLSWERRRFEHSWRRSWLLLWNSVVFYAAVAALEFFGIDALVAAFKPEITHVLSALAGSVLGSIADIARTLMPCNLNTAALHA